VAQKAEYYNPIEEYNNLIGEDYNTIIDFFEKNDLKYMRLVSDLDRSYLIYYSSSDTTLRGFYFNDDNICYGVNLIYLSKSKKIDEVITWLNKNCEKMPNDSMTWKTSKQNLVYNVREDFQKIVSLWCKSEKHQQSIEQDKKIIVDFSKSYIHDSANGKWLLRYEGNYDRFDSVKNEWFDYKFSTDRFIIPEDLNGKIEHFRPQGKIITYKIDAIFQEDENEYYNLGVIDEDGEKFLFLLYKDFSCVVFLLFGDSETILFSNE